MALLFFKHFALSDLYCLFQQLSVCFKKGLFAEEQTFYVFEFYLDHSFVAMKLSFQKKCNVRNGPPHCTIEALYGKFQSTGNVGRPSIAIEINVRNIGSPTKRN